MVDRKSDKSRRKFKRGHEEYIHLSEAPRINLIYFSILPSLWSSFRLRPGRTFCVPLADNKIRCSGKPQDASWGWSCITQTPLKKGALGRMIIRMIKKLTGFFIGSTTWWTPKKGGFPSITQGFSGFRELYRSILIQNYRAIMKKPNILAITTLQNMLKSKQ